MDRLKTFGRQKEPYLLGVPKLLKQIVEVTPPADVQEGRFPDDILDIIAKALDKPFELPIQQG